MASGTLRADTFQDNDGTGPPEFDKGLKVSAAAPATPTANVLYKDSIVRGWVQFDGSSGSLTPADEYNVASLDDNGTGNYDINWDLDFANANYCVVITVANTGSNAAIGVYIHPTGGIIAGTVEMQVINASHAGVDSEAVCAMAIGDQ